MVIVIMRKRCGVYRVFLKRLFDIVLTIILLLILSPLLLLLLVVGLVVYKGPLYLSLRAGLHGQSFTVIKFKSMNDKRDANGVLLNDGRRLGLYGRLIRGLSLDELPQLLNVLKGDMSLIGPRPLLESYVPLYNKQQSRRHEVRPGITGWAQVNGRNTLSWQDKFKHDIYYVDNLSFLLDLKIFLMTIKKVIDRDGVSSCDSATMEPFTGNVNES